MEMEKLLMEMANQGGVRVWRVSNGWLVVYRLKAGRWEAANLVRATEGNWLVSGATGETGGRQNIWQPVLRIHHRALPIELNAARKQKGYYLGLERRCETCKLVKSSHEFERLDDAEQGFRTWECNQCAAERDREVSSLRKSARVGDYLRRNTHASKPPVESEI